MTGKITVGLLAATLLCAAYPTGAAAQVVLERPRRSTQAYDRSYQVGFDAGYRTGYDKGLGDFRDSEKRDVNDFSEYRNGDTGYNSTIGDREEYRNGYRAGFLKGYEDGSDGRSFGHQPGDDRVNVPTTPDGTLKRGNDNQSSDPGGKDFPDPGPDRRVNFDTALVVELETPISTRFSQAGDQFTATVLEGPSSGAKVRGYVGKVVEPGRVDGTGEIILVFQGITFPDGYQEAVEAQVEEIIGYNGQYPKAGRKKPWDRSTDRNSDIDATVDDEGRIEGTKSTGKDAATVGAGAVAGAIIGGILGGGGGAAAGAAVGGAAGGGVVAATRGSQIDLEPGCQLRIRTGKSAKI